MHVYYLCVIDQSLLALKYLIIIPLLWTTGLALNPSLPPRLSSGEISTRTILDREQQSSYQLVVVVQDGGSPSRSATGTAFITVLDDNDNDPAFAHSHSGKNLVIQVIAQDKKHRKGRKLNVFHIFVDIFFNP